MKQRRAPLALAALLALLLCASCIPGDGKNSAEKPAGFWTGIWHGWIAPVSLVAELFKPELSVYEEANKGFWYDLGFYMAVISGFGGLALSRKKRSA
ncbi:MAG TPA: hypothetical protein P5165_06510 [Spirochaetia bacterium]|nr:hypothetical protein [Spirochaetia bacterium]